MKNARLGWVVLSLLLTCSVAVCGTYYPIPDQLARPEMANGQLGRDALVWPAQHPTLKSRVQDPRRSVYRDASVYRRGYLPESYGDIVASETDQLPREASIYDRTDNEATIYNRGWIDSTGRMLFPLWGVTYPTRMNGSGIPVSRGRPYYLGPPEGYGTNAPYTYRSRRGEEADGFAFARSLYGTAGVNPNRHIRFRPTAGTENRSYIRGKRFTIPKSYQGGPNAADQQIDPRMGSYSRGYYEGDIGYGRR